MDKIERANDRAKRAIIEWLVASVEQEHDDDEAMVSIYAWEKSPYSKLLETKDYILERNKHTNPALLWYMNLCVAEADRVKQQPKTRVEVLA